MELDNDLIIDPQVNAGGNISQTYEVDANNTIPPKGLAPDKVTVSDGPLGESIPGELPEFQAEFEIVSDQATKVVSFKDIESMLLGNGGLSVESAKHIEQVTGDFLSSIGYTEKYFTKETTQVGYKAAMEHLGRKIATESDELTANASSLISKYIDDKHHNLLEYYNNDFRFLKYSIKNTINSDTLTAMQIIINSPNRVIQYGDETIDLCNTALDSFNKQDNIDSNYTAIINTISGIRTLLCKKTLTAAIAYTIDSIPVDKFFSDRTAALAVISNIPSLTLSTLYGLFDDNKFVNTIDTLFSELDNDGGYLKTAIAKLDGFKDSNELTPGNIMGNEELLQNTLMSLHCLDVMRVIVPLFITLIRESVDNITAII